MIIELLNILKMGYKQYFVTKIEPLKLISYG